MIFPRTAQSGLEDYRQSSTNACSGIRTLTTSSTASIFIPSSQPGPDPDQLFPESKAGQMVFRQVSRHSSRQPSIGRLCVCVYLRVAVFPTDFDRLSQSGSVDWSSAVIADERCEKGAYFDDQRDEVEFIVVPFPRPLGL